MRAAGKAELRVQEREHARQHELELWAEVDRRIESALEAQRAAILEIVQEGFRAASDLGDAVSNRFDDLEMRLEKVRTLLTEAREPARAC